MRMPTALRTRPLCRVATNERIVWKASPLANEGALQAVRDSTTMSDATPTSYGVSAIQHPACSNKAVTANNLEHHGALLVFRTSVS